MDLPQFLKIDFSKKTIRPAAAGDETPASPIERQEVVDGKLILQGAEDGYEKMRDGLGWTMAISEETGAGGADSLRRAGCLRGFRCLPPPVILG